jgi:hypothetical protein
LCGKYAVHSGAAITFATATTTINGNIGVSPGTSITGIPVLQNGAEVASGNTNFATSVIKNHAEAMAPQLYGGNDMAIEMGGLTFTPGTYRSGSAINIAANTVVTLDGLNQAHPRFLFQAGSAMTTGATTTFNLINGARAQNVVWALGTALTLGANSVLEGTVLAGSAVTFGANSQVHGCVLAQTAITFPAAGSVDPSYE